MRIAVPSVTKVKRAHGIARTTQPSHRFVQRAPIAKANGTERDANPANITGGWITIHGSWRRGFSPWPSAGICSRNRKGGCLTRITTMATNDRT